LNQYLQKMPKKAKKEVMNTFFFAVKKEQKKEPALMWTVVYLRNKL